MREWMRALMRRRNKRGVNDSESTGKIGQEIPANQPTPLQPMYPEKSRSQALKAEVSDPVSDLPDDLQDDLGDEAAVDSVKKPARAPAPSLPSAVTDVAPDDADDEPNDAPDDAEEPPAPVEGKLVVETQPESPSLPPDMPSAGPKDIKGYVVLAIGLPGSGKTTWFKRRGVTPLSSDMLRSILFDDITEQRYQGLVFSTLRSLLRARLDRQDAMELCGCHEPVGARAAAMDQDG